MRKLLLILDFLLCLSLSTSHPSFLPGYFQNARPHRKEPKLKRPPEEESTAFESDIISTSEQVNRLAKEILTGNRKRRQTVQATKIWPNGIIVYKYDDNWPNSRLGNLSKSNIEKAMKMWQDKTCVKFIRQTPTTPKIGHYGSVVNILFGRTCQTLVGRFEYGPQDLEVGRYCAYKPGYLAHLLGHVIGLFHEQNRPDRDKYITVIGAIRRDKWQFFNKANGNHTEQIHEPYDIGSIMHSGAPMLNNYNFTFQPKDKRLMAAMGQRTHLSFMDIKKVNDLYTCNRNCPRGPKCKNEGYIGPNCSCFCPLDLTGRKCKNVVQSSSGCGGVLKKSSGTFSSPGYPQKYPNSTRCTWLIKGTAGSTISLKFTSFEIEDDVSCYFDYIEVKTYGLTLEGPSRMSTKTCVNVMYFLSETQRRKINQNHELLAISKGQAFMELEKKFMIGAVK
ncbi:unnamed protein product [Mytilus coruscus]|uniref:Metalloendopeptidase n=1 Tax=Mytilus coruscus TaxID=42192 RepID=A0A6J8C4T6_MYTCO|nr:unnamed protein product [Mytilus coruscus]